MKTQILIFSNCRTAISLILLVGLLSCPIYAVSNDKHLFFSVSDLLQDTKQKPTIKLTGTVKDSFGALGGVIVTVGTTIVTTDLDGKYTIDITSGDKITFSMMGYKDQSIVYTGGSSLNITLSEDNNTLDEIVVNAGYYTVKDRERTGSIAKIKQTDIEKTPVKDFIGTLQGRITGVQVSQKSGVPGSGYSIKIRGNNSLRSSANNPLYIIDGIPIPSDNMSSSIISGGSIPQGGISPLNNINLEDIESIEILKDADATSIYGSRGANGVVLITTKQNKERGTHFTLNSSTGVGHTINRMKMMNTQEYLSMRETAFTNDNILDYPVDAYDVNGVWDKNRYTNWRKELLGETAHFNRVHLKVTGGNANTRFLISTTTKQESSVFKANTLYKQLSFFSSMNHTSKDERFKLLFSTSYSKNDNKLPSIDLTKQAYSLSPNAPKLYNVDGTLNWEDGTWENPLARTNSIYKNKTQSFTIGGDLSYQLSPSITAKINIGYINYNNYEINTLPSTIYNPKYGRTSTNSSLYLNQGNTNTLITEPQISWNKGWGIHNIQVLLGGSFQQQNTDILNLTASNFISNSLIESIGAANSIRVNSHLLNQYRYQAFFSRINYQFKNQGFINLTARRDGSSRFGDNNRFANFGAIGAAWILINNQNIKASDIINFAKIRASYGTTGSDQIGDYQYLDTYSVNSNSLAYYDGSVAIQPSRLYNPSFGWEINRKFEVALDLNFFNDKIVLNTAWYKNTSSNQLVGLPLAATTGFNTIQANLDAKVQNTGLEIDLIGKIIDTKDWKWSSSFNVSFEQNKLLKFPNLESSPYANQYVIGKSTQIQKMYHYQGVDPVTGQYKFKDFNEDGKLTYTDDRESLIDLNPKYYGGITNNISYKNWSLSFLFTFSKQTSILYNLTNGVAGDMINQPKMVKNNFDQSPSNDFQKYTSGRDSKLTEAYYDYFIESDYLAQNSSFIKLKSLELSYMIPKIINNNIQGKIYFQGYNLLTISPFKGIDPETSNFNFLPPTRTFTIGAELNF
ncbi:SusC/RagA family TonB-linked outer membrane protein [Myroides sp.]|uniref:SusC/RagA family TonB-linked outer membrane protein n=1 Tax=Myroides sp. TaxID=1874736 RepID=UPI0028ABC5B1|nr:SusC/RagA family TonB-linked outer membrane protein [Myroides sp.]